MDPFIGQIIMFAGNFAPRGWALCNGQILPIAQNTALFSILGTQYGGNGQTTFALPDLRGRIPVHQGQGPGLSPYAVGQVAGAASATLTSGQLPIHTHTVSASTNNADKAPPAGAVWAVAQDGGGTGFAYTTAAKANATMAPQAVGQAGGSQPFPTLEPYLCVNFIIATEGVYPSRN